MSADKIYNDKVVCDIVLLSWNSLDKLKNCVESVKRNTDLRSRLIIVDNASENPVREWISTVRPGGMIKDVTVLQNESNEGFSKGINRGIRESTAQYVCLLNNDTIAFPHWLSRLYEVAESDTGIGILNPNSSTFSEHVPDGMDPESYARSLEPMRGEYLETSSCIGFCMLIKREVITKIGGLEESFGPFFYEDDDYCARAYNEGFTSVIVAASYVFHDEHSSVKKVRAREAIFRESRRKFFKRWGKQLRVAFHISSPLVLGQEHVKIVLNQAISWARERAVVKLFFNSTSQSNFDSKELFSSVGIVPHTDVAFYPLNRAARLTCLWMIIKKQRKRFDLIVTDDKWFARILFFFSLLHRADIVLADETEKLERKWQKRSRCL